MGLSRRRFLGAIAAASGLVAIGVERPARATTPDITPRRVQRVIAPFRDLVGDVFEVRRTIPAASVAQVSPFILLDHFDFRIAKGELGGLAPHPHRGFETVTVLLEGAIEHGDSLGNRAVLESGAIQWMTAGSGIVHEENPANILRERGGRVLGIQLWVNLPSRAKLTPPRYQDTTTARIPEAAEGGVRARVFAGRIHDVPAVIHTETAMTLVDYTLAPGSEVALEYPAGWTAFLHVVDGAIDVGGTAVPAEHMAVLAQQGSGLYFRNAATRPSRVLLGGGAPIEEPLARSGPFAMNTQAELAQAIDDYRSGRMGRVANPTYDRIRPR
jgi:redox-sensitive bicupin YhaK (pirin superfamily)